MRVKELAAKYKLDPGLFENYLRHSQYKDLLIDGSSGAEIDSDDYIRIVHDFRMHRNQVDTKKTPMTYSEKQKAYSNILITPGYNFDGYHVAKYSDFISGDAVVSVARGLAKDDSIYNHAQEKLTSSLPVIRRDALSKLKEAASTLGCNAIIGVDYDYITLEPETLQAMGGPVPLPYVFAVTVSGTAVIIEKDDCKEQEQSSLQ